MEPIEAAPEDWSRLDMKKFVAYSIVYVAGLRFVLYPAVLIKTRLQVQQGTTKYDGILDAFKKIARAEGPRGFYKGFFATTLGVIPANGAYIFTLEAVRANGPRLPIPGVPREWSSNFVAGGVASLVSSAISVPLDVVSQRLMVQDGRPSPHQPQYEYRGVLHALSTIYRTDGVRGLYRGYGATLLTFVPSSSIWWSTYGVLSERAKRTSVLSEHPLVVHGLCGVGAGVSSAVLTTPLDVAKTRMQVLNGPQKNIVQTMVQIVGEEGWQGLMKGMRPRVLNTIPFSLAMIVIYQHVKQLSLKS